MADHLVLKGGTWHVRLDVPEDVRDHPDFLSKKVLTKTLKTRSRHEAKDLSREILASWKRSIDLARKKKSLDSWRIRAEASRKMLNDMMMQARTPEAFEQANAYRIAEMARIFFEYRLNDEEAEEAKSIFLKNQRPKTIVSPSLIIEFEKYQSDNWVIPKTASTQASSIRNILKFLEANDLSFDHESISKYLDSLDSLPKTKQNRLFAGNAFWNFLISRDKSIKEQANPFKGHEISTKRGKNRSQSESYEAFEKHEVELIYDACKEKGDTQLSNAIKIAAYTGLRIEEICRLKTTSVVDNIIKVEDAKTRASNRQVPVHTKIRDLIKLLSSKSTDGYLIESSGGNKFGKRSDPLSKRFGRLKTQLKFGKGKVFHSIRKTTATLLHQADVHPLVIMNIMGHKTNTITFDVYSSGSSIAQMQSALEKLSFNFDRS